MSKKILLVLFIIFIVCFVIMAFLIFNMRKSNHEKNNSTLLDYFKIASVDYYLDIAKSEGKMDMRYMYSLHVPNSEAKDIRKITDRKITLLSQKYIPQGGITMLNSVQYKNFPEDIMDSVYSDVKFYHPNGLQPVLTELKDNKAMSENYGEYTMSLSFDKGYSVDEAKYLLSEYGDVVWLWVDTYKNQEILSKTEFLTGECHLWEGKSKKRIIDPNIGQAFGIKMIDERNRSIENPEGVFIDILNKYDNPKKNKVSEKIYEVKQSIKKDKPIEREDLKILGCILKSSKDNAMKLAEKSFVKSIYIGFVN